MRAMKGLCKLRSRHPAGILDVGQDARRNHGVRRRFAHPLADQRIGLRPDLFDDPGRTPEFLEKG